MYIHIISLQPETRIVLGVESQYYAFMGIAMIRIQSPCNATQKCPMLLSKLPSSGQSWCLQSTSLQEHYSGPDGIHVKYYCKGRVSNFKRKELKLVVLNPKTTTPKHAYARKPKF